MKATYLVGGPIPETNGRTADLFAEVRTLRIAMQKEVDEVKARESELREYLIDNLSKSDDTGAAGLRYRAQITQKTKPKVEDWDKFHAYVQKTGRFDLMQKRLSDKAVMDMLNEGDKVPGTETIHIPEVSITKVK